jgi:hypothetical protein
MVAGIGKMIERRNLWEFPFELGFIDICLNYGFGA